MSPTIVIIGAGSVVFTRDLLGDVLSFPELGMLSMGASVSHDAHGQLGYAMTMVWTPVTNWTSYTYSWAQAQAAGAGSERQSAVNPPVTVAQNN